MDCGPNAYEMELPFPNSYAIPNWQDLSLEPIQLGIMIFLPKDALCFLFPTRRGSWSYRTKLVGCAEPVAAGLCPAYQLINEWNQRSGILACKFKCAYWINFSMAFLAVLLVIKWGGVVASRGLQLMPHPFFRMQRLGSMWLTCLLAIASTSPDSESRVMSKAKGYKEHYYVLKWHKKLKKILFHAAGSHDHF